MNLKSVKLTSAQKETLKTKYAHKTIDATVWAELEEACRQHFRDFQQIKTLWKDGTLQKDDMIVVNTPTLKGCTMAVDVDQVCDTELKYYKLFKKDYLRWVLQRVKLIQMRLVGHESYIKYKNLEAERIARMK